MKKFWMFMGVMLLWSVPNPVLAVVGSCTQDVAIVQSSVSQSGEARVLTFTCTGGTAGDAGAIAAITISDANVKLLKSWYLYMAQSTPGVGGLTADWDYTLKDGNGLDKMGGNGTDMSATLSQERMPLIAAGIGFAKPLKSAWIFAITNNSVASSPVVVDFWFVQ